MTVKYYAISLNMNGPVPDAEIKRVLGEGKSWLKFHANFWVVATELSATDWYERVRSVLSPSDHIFVVKIDLSDHKGWVATIMADWLRLDFSSKEGL